jgi:NTE family protein
MIRNLALKGGGVLGIAYVGAIRELEKRKMYDGLAHVSGTSAGALVAGMIAVGFNSKQIERLMHQLDFKKFKSGWNPLRIFTRYGLYHGDYILDFIHNFLKISKYQLPENATFADLQKAGCKDLTVFASDLNLHTFAEFSVFATPNCIVAEAIRASMSIPLYFKAWKFSNGIPNDHIYVDGGLVYNYPLSFFDQSRFHKKKGFNKDTLGFYLESKKLYDVEVAEGTTKSGNGKYHKKNFYTFLVRFGQLFTFFKHGFDTLLNAQGIDFMEDNHLVARTIFISDLGISATNFNLTDEDKKRLIESGKVGAKRYFKWKKKKQKKKHKKTKQPN